jgi:hypothetical protein
VTVGSNPAYPTIMASSLLSIIEDEKLVDSRLQRLCDLMS